MTAARCEQTGLLTPECAHCTGATLAGDPTDLVIAYTFEAAYPGECGHCEASFERGQTVGRVRESDWNDRGVIVCPDCTRKAEASR